MVVEGVAVLGSIVGIDLSKAPGTAQAPCSIDYERKKVEAEESSSASQKGTRRTASLPAWAMRSAHCPLRLGHCPLRQRIVRMPITPPQCGLSPERNAPPCCLLRAPRYCSQLSALSAPLSLCALSSALRSQRRSALSAPLSASPISRSPSLSAVTTTLRSQLALSLLHSVTTSTAPAAHLGSVRPQGPRIHAR